MGLLTRPAGRYSIAMFETGAADVVLSNLLFSLSQVVIHSCLPQVIVLLVCQELGLSGIALLGFNTSCTTYQSTHLILSVSIFLREENFDNVGRSIKIEVMVFQRCCTLSFSALLYSWEMLPICANDI